MQQPTVLVFKPSLKKETDRKAQLATIQASKALSEIVRTTLGPRSMLKMLLDPMGGIVITNDGNSILREIDVANPAAKSLIELSRSLDEEVGDGTTSCVVLCGQVLSNCTNLLKKEIHPTEIVKGLMDALEDSIKALEQIAIEVNPSDHDKLLQVVESCLGTKLSSRWGNLTSKLALESVLKLYHNSQKSSTSASNGTDGANGPAGVTTGYLDVKRLIKIEKVPGGLLEDSKVLDGIVINKDVTHAGMSRRIVNPRVLILDCTLEYKKGESQTMVDITSEEAWNELLLQEESEIRQMCQHVIDSGCNVVITEKGVSDLAQHYLVKAGITCIRRVRKSDANRIAKCTGATVVNRPEEITKQDVGHSCRLFYVDKIGDEYYSYFVDCEKTKSCSIVLRGGSKDVLNEVERNMYDALNVCRNILTNCKLLPGGGATEIYVSNYLNRQIQLKSGLKRLSYESACKAFEIIPKTLAQNCGANPVRVISDLLSLHASGSHSMGIDGETGEIVDVVKKNLFDTFAVKEQVYKSAIESACMLLRIDIIVSGIGQKEPGADQKVAINEDALQEQA
ncbi:T-complex protein 1 chaperonin [Theileria orientalis]|uniref:T-complex protein 1 subunit gamma n=1 Tax=Theileria orientalis TaxID=68886 RepID=A0A976M6H3_THEOR|nr:T-complex protein 1 chaperonin [Theileria orientalis]